MMQPGYQEGSERTWWWKVAQHLDDAQLAAVNAMAHNVDYPTPVHALQDKLREAQGILLEIFRWKGLLPGSTNGKIENGKAENGKVEPPIAMTVQEAVEAMAVAAQAQEAVVETTVESTNAAVQDADAPATVLPSEVTPSALLVTEPPSEA